MVFQFKFEMQLSGLRTICLVQMSTRNIIFKIWARRYGPGLRAYNLGF
jgi:hypothetical protein